MNIEKAKSFCSKFDPVVKDGKAKCKHIINGKCLLPDYFRCELEVHLDRETYKAQGIEHFSVSRINTFSKCARKYFFDYIAHTSPPIMQEWFWAGSKWSVVRAKIDAGLPWKPLVPDWSKVTEVAYWKMVAMMEVYDEYVKHGHGEIELAEESERKIVWSLDGLPFVSYLDGDRDARATIIEWKYSKAVPDRLSISRQAISYFHASPEAKRLALQTAKKTMHKIADGETGEEFKNRIIQTNNYAPERIFSKTVYTRDDFDIKSELERMIVLANSIMIAKQKMMFPPEFSSCTMCSYKKYCQSHAQIGCKSPNCMFPEICRKVKLVLPS